ncbi:GIMA4 GTPase, partial [Amia calva]|nr:GIMA4 GTPase [Amia calva]
LRIVLLGGRVDGKSSSGNTILGREEFKTGRGTETVIEECKKSQGEVAGRKVTVVDTPGWAWNSVWDTPECVEQEIVHSVSLCPPGPHAILLVFPVGFIKETHRKSVEEHMKLLSQKVWRNTILLFTWGDLLGDTTIEQHIEKWEALQWLVEKCGNRYHVLRGDCTQVTELLEKIEEMVEVNDENYFSIEIYQYWEKQIRKEVKEILKEKKQQILREQEELKTKHQIELKERERMREEIQKLNGKIRKLQERVEEMQDRLGNENDEQSRRELEGELRKEQQKRDRLERKRK